MTPAIPEPKPSAEALTVPALLQAIAECEGRWCDVDPGPDFRRAQDIAQAIFFEFRTIKARARELSASAPANAPAATPREKPYGWHLPGFGFALGSECPDYGENGWIPLYAPAATGDAVRALFTFDEELHADLMKLRANISQADRTAIVRRCIDRMRKLSADKASESVQHGETCRSPDEREDCDALRMRMADLLTRTANALKGEPKPRSQHSWHDLPEVAAVFNSPNKGHVYYHAGDHDCPKSIKAPNGEVHTLMCKLCALKQSEAKKTYCAGAVAKALSADKASGEVGR